MLKPLENKLTRSSVVEKLERVSPAMATRDLIPVLSMFWFTGEWLMTHNDQIAISVPFQSDFMGAVPRTLLELLNRSRASDLEMEPINEGGAEDFLYVKVGKTGTKIKLPLQPPDSFLFKMPEPTDNVLDLSAKEFLPVLELCLKTVCKDMSIPDQIGITLQPNGPELDLYSLNGPNLTQAWVKYSGKRRLGKRVILHGQFCEQLLKLVKPTDPLHLEIHDSYSLVKTVHGEILHGRLIEVEHPVDFPAVMARHFSEDQAGGLVPIPERLKLVVDRALVVTDSNTDPGQTEISVKNGRMHFVSAHAGRGRVEDQMRIEENHPPVQASFSVKHLKVGMDAYDKILITDRCVIMSGNNATFLVAAAG